MPVQVTAYKVLIASPSDVKEERSEICDIINSVNPIVIKMGVMFVPVMWEKNSNPEMGDRPQEILNKQFVRDCDILVGTFWTRIGTHSGKAESGTVEEIQEFLNMGKRVKLYFSSKPINPCDIDFEQYKCLEIYKKDCMSKGIVDQYSSLVELSEKLRTHLIMDVANNLHKSTQSDKQIKNDIDEKEHLLSEFKIFVRKLELEWKNEKNSEPDDINQAKLLLQNYVNKVLDFRINFENNNLQKELLVKFDEFIKRTKVIQRHQLYSDGGVSYKRFWEIGDDIVNKIVYFARNISFNRW